MIVGDKATFAIESSITKAYARLGFRALGYFVLHIGGKRYGVYAPDATMLACSFDAVSDRIRRKGEHTASFALEPDAGKIADSYRDAKFDLAQEESIFFGLSNNEFREIIRSSHLVLAPDGDEAFDDRSNVLHFDLEDRVRLIAFRCLDGGYHHNPQTLSDVWMDAEIFYDTLDKWHTAFEKEWIMAPKISEADDGAEIK